MQRLEARMITEGGIRKVQLSDGMFSFAIPAECWPELVRLGSAAWAQEQAWRAELDDLLGLPFDERFARAEAMR